MLRTPGNPLAHITLQKPNEKRDLVRRLRRAVVGCAKREGLHESEPPLSLTKRDALTSNWASGIGQIV